MGMYILIDNSHQITKIIKYNEHDELKKKSRNYLGKITFIMGFFLMIKMLLYPNINLE